MLKNTRISDLAQFLDLQNGLFTVINKLSPNLRGNCGKTKTHNFFHRFMLSGTFTYLENIFVPPEVQSARRKRRKSAVFSLKVLRISQLSLHL